MKLLLLTVLSIICLVPICNSQALPVQSHSFDDLDYIIQQLIKGVDTFKFDISQVDHESCTTYSTWHEKDNSCVWGDNKIEICCLGLRGDSSSSPRLNDYFNTTNDLINLFNNQKYDFIWQKEKRLPAYNRPIYIAMNIQFSDDKGDIVKNWLANMVTVIASRGLDVHFIFGSGTLLNYFGDLCASGASACDDKVKTIMAAEWILQSTSQNPSSSTYGVIENFNIEFPTIPEYCSTYFPAYADVMPYFFYEIAHEADVQYISNTYMSDTCNRTAAHESFSSIRITSNVDPEMLQSYLPGPELLKGLNAANILIETLEADSQVLLSYFDLDKQATYVQIRTLDPSNFLSVVSQVTVSGDSFTKLSYKAPYLLLQNATQSQIVLLNATPSLSLTPAYSVSNSGLDSDIAVYNNEVYLVQIQVEGSCPASSLSFNIINLNSSTVVFSHCSDKIQPFDVHEIQSTSLSVVLQGSGGVRGILFVSANYKGLNEDKDALFAFTFNADLSNSDLPQSSSIQTPQSYIDFGVDPSVKLVANNSVLYVLEAHSNGLCQCADFLNNGNVYKCGISGTSNPHVAYLQNVDYLMNYNWGRLDDFENRIQSGRYISGCDSQIMHAKFYNGEKPNGIVFRDEKTGVLQALVVNQFVDYDELPFITKLFCGATMPTGANGPDGSAVANLFNLLDFSIFNSI